MPVLPYLAVGATALGAEQSIIGGMNADSAAKQEAALQRDQASLALKNAQDNASVEAYNDTQLVQRQKVAFLANGVTLEGSPAEVLKNTTTMSQQNVQAILDRGVAQYNLGQREAAQTQAKGRTALLAGLATAGTDVVKGASDAYKSGIFDSKTTTTKTTPRIEGVDG